MYSSRFDCMYTRSELKKYTAYDWEHKTARGSASKSFKHIILESAAARAASDRRPELLDAALPRFSLLWALRDARTASDAWLA